jgi:hypothetical protein
MKITIATLYSDRTADHWVGAFRGEISEEKKRVIAHDYGAALDGDDDAHQEDGRTMGFRVVDLAESPDGIDLTNIWE